MRPVKFGKVYILNGGGYMYAILKTLELQSEVTPVQHWPPCADE